MSNSIVSSSGLPRAIAKEKDGIVLYWVEELGVAGLSLRGLAKLLQYNAGTLSKILKGVDRTQLLQAEAITEGGIQGVDLYPETLLSEILLTVVQSNAKPETRAHAAAVIGKLAAAGFKLMVMLELAPAELAARAIEHLDKEIKVQKLKNEGERLKCQAIASEYNLLAFRDTVLKLQPRAVADRILGVTTIEKTEIRTKIVDEAGFVLNAGETVSKTALAERYGFVSRTGKADTKTVTQLIEEAIAVGAIDNPWRDVRVVASAGFDASLVPTLDRFVRSSPRERQLWVGE